MNSHSTDSGQKDSRRQLRSFAFILAGAFMVIALWPTVFRGDAPRTWALVVSVVFAVWGVLHPSSLEKPYRAWMTLGGFLGWINSKVILSAVFFVIVTPIRMLMALFRYDPMNRRLDRNAETYRVARQPRSASHMSRQF